MLIKNVRVRNRKGILDIYIKNGKIEKISENINNIDHVQVIDGKEAFVMPPYVDSHNHFDYAATYGQPVHNKSVTLFEGLDIWEMRKKRLTDSDIKKRAKKVLEWQIAQGVQYIRTHVNDSERDLMSLSAMLEFREEMKKFVDIQIVAFPQYGLLSFENGLELLEEAIKMSAEVVGAIPHLEDTREDAVASLERMFEIAEKYQVLVDVHCDEIDDDQSRSLEVLASLARKYEMGPLVTASHTTAMHSYNNAYTAKLFRLLERTNINFVVNPVINLHLQGRYDSYPVRRGVTRVKELLEAGLNVSLGNDDITDPFYPFGTGNMLDVLYMLLHVSHLLGYEHIRNSFDLITTNGAQTLNIKEHYGIEEGKPANLIILPAENEYDIIRRRIKPIYSIRNGEIIAKSTPETFNVYLDKGAKRRS